WVKKTEIVKINISIEAVRKRIVQLGVSSGADGVVRIGDDSQSRQVEALVFDVAVSLDVLEHQPPVGDLVAPDYQVSLNRDLALEIALAGEAGVERAGEPRIGSEGLEQRVEGFQIREVDPAVSFIVKGLGQGSVAVEVYVVVRIKVDGSVLDGCPVTVRLG